MNAFTARCERESVDPSAGDAKLLLRVLLRQTGADNHVLVLLPLLFRGWEALPELNHFTHANLRVRIAEGGFPVFENAGVNPLTELQEMGRGRL